MSEGKTDTAAAPVAADPGITGPGPDTTARVRRILAGQGILIAFVLFMIAFGLTSERFFTTSNIEAVLRSGAVIGVMALGVTVVVLSGNLDLSVGSMLSFGTVMVVDLHDKIGAFPAIVVMMLAVLALGCVNGALVGILRLNSLIVTLGMLSAIQGLTLIYSGGQNVDIDPSSQSTTWFRVFGRGEIGGLDMPIILFAVLAVILHCVVAYTPFGRRVYAVGGNPTAAVFSGIRRGRVVFATYLISAACVGLAAIMLGSRVMGSQNNVGQGYELLVLACVILGGTSLLGGSGTIWRTVIGVLILGFIQNGLLLLGYPYYAQWIVTWIVIILAVWLDVAGKRGRLLSPIA